MTIVTMFGRKFSVPRGLKVEQGPGFCRVVEDPEYIKRIGRKQKSISAEVISSNYEDFEQSIRQPDFKMKDWLLNHLPEGKDKECVKNGNCFKDQTDAQNACDISKATE
jgi:hypothetical protein